MGFESVTGATEVVISGGRVTGPVGQFDIEP